MEDREDDVDVDAVEFEEVVGELAVGEDVELIGRGAVAENEAVVGEGTIGLRAAVLLRRWRVRAAHESVRRRLDAPRQRGRARAAQIGLGHEGEAVPTALFGRLLQAGSRRLIGIVVGRLFCDREGQNVGRLLGVKVRGDGLVGPGGSGEVVESGMSLNGNGDLIGRRAMMRQEWIRTVVETRRRRQGKGTVGELRRCLRVLRRPSGKLRGHGGVGGRPVRLQGGEMARFGFQLGDVAGIDKGRVWRSGRTTHSASTLQERGG
jgi:hypothetical protein